ncbi:conserved hypothetical protein [Verticillium alfalfae VaMs.102]|uniref:C2H2-type domain-containing protein n=1 Tax=Verticillium alfalfae (strain VaMs.102 / ATCC MYA-4576 / FGSC 10136) TaxID=526221 RepID=C9SZ42_VERA1|nr:conserved hypothetical protein [Verticillium alfalfae VaMs.102]EEY24057.1 conserved hypothetical protein [Verticillium alfalfae VaMs.102]
MSSVFPPEPHPPAMAPGATAVRVEPLSHLSMSRERQRKAREALAQFQAEPIAGRASVTHVTRKQRQSSYQKWQNFFRNVLGLNPDDIWLRLCDGNPESIGYCQAFLHDYVVNSLEKRVSLGPEEYELARTVTCTKTILEVWKGLVRHADDHVLQAKRRSDPKKSAHWTLSVSERCTGPVSKISLTIYPAPHLNALPSTLVLMMAIGGFRQGTLTRFLLSFSVTSMPCLLTDLSSLIISKALKDKAFSGKYGSALEMLSVPNLQGQHLIPLPWDKSMLERPIFEISPQKYHQIWQRTLLVLGCRRMDRPYSLRVGAAGRVDDPHPEDYAKWNQRRDIQELDKQLAEIPRTTAADKENAQRIASRRGHIVATLSKLQVMQRREEYFLEADRLRGQGRSIEHLVSRTMRPKAGRYTVSSAAATIISRYMVRCSGIDMLATTKYIDLLVAFLSNRFSEVEHLESTATTILTSHGIDKEADKQLFLQPPTIEPPLPVEKGHIGVNMATEYRCLFGCKPLSSRYALNRHVASIHRDTFSTPFHCPECLSQDKKEIIINGLSEWIIHATRYHGKRNAPYRPQKSSPASSGRSRRIRSPRKAECKLCQGQFAAGNGFSRHMNSAHLHQGLFDEPFPCPECKNAGVEVWIEGIECWREHTWEVHGYKGQTGNRKSDEEPEAAGLGGMGMGKKSIRV